SDSNAPVLDAAGRVLIAGYSVSDAYYRCTIVALLPSGMPDPAFGESGLLRIELQPDKDTYCIGIATQADKIIVLGIEDGSPSPASLRRLSADGTLDTTFGAAGIVSLPIVGNVYWRSATVAADGSIFVTGADDANGYVLKLTAIGAIDSAFATSGIFRTPFASAGLFPPKVLADGSLLAAGFHSGNHVVMHIAPNGTLDPAFGVGGVAEFSYGVGYSAIGVDVQKDGKIVAGLRLNTAANTWRLAAIRLNGDGSLDPSYGDGGISILDSAGVDETTYGMALAPDGKLWLFGRADLSDADTGLAVGRLLGPEITTRVVEFYNIDLDHYFITADVDEAAAIDAGAAGAGWHRTGQGWMSGGPTRVCRFYGSPDLNPVTGNRAGPNSHFYTIDSAECAAVKRDIGWRFESYDFNGWPTSFGTCPADTIAVTRMYNNRFAENDSNHRYVIDDAIKAEMVAKAWVSEGVVFCAIQ
ncbi:MAG: hypothetical protein ABI854_01395, partial [Betaproteobacteria bacterium]